MSKDRLERVVGKDEVQDRAGWMEKCTEYSVQEGQRRCLMWIDARLGGLKGLRGRGGALPSRLPFSVSRLPLSLPGRHKPSANLLLASHKPIPRLRASVVLSECMCVPAARI